MQMIKSRRRHSKKQLRAKLTQLKRELRKMRTNVSNHRKPLSENLLKASRLGEKLEQLWQQPVYFDELTALVQRYEGLLEGGEDTGDEFRGRCGE